MIRLYDTARGEVRDLSLRSPGRVTMYVCGPTVDNLPHLGHGRYTLVWDVARRWFTFQGLSVHYVSNITDVDDKIIARARRESRSESDVVAQYEAEWWDAMARLGVALPDDTPHATHYVDEMKELIASFLERDVAYTTSDGIYFDVSSVEDYGLLAGQPLESLRAGARVEGNDEKRSPLDFALWKNAKPDEPNWAAPFGEGRPGWHTECVVMALDVLGEDFDLHCGGLDLKFPHHENERAQAEAAHKGFARHWAHNGWVMVGGEKMSSSLNNFTSLTDLLEKTDARAYRLLVLRSHYRSPIEVTPLTIADAERALDRLDSLARRFVLPEMAGESFELASSHPWEDESLELYERVATLMNDDLNTPLAVAELFDALSVANTMADEGHEASARRLAQSVGVLFGAFGLTLLAGSHVVDEVAQKLVLERDAARSTKNWTEADRLRDELVERGWIVEDGASGTLIRRP
ncbi:MAG TPA: cysteine--tRNA ligase [Acidimicrobiales bacterium]|nr:cysteine--tRNA ligase [Acidimicrobiales bacterium]